MMDTTPKHKVPPQTVRSAVFRSLSRPLALSIIITFITVSTISFSFVFFQFSKNARSSLEERANNYIANLAQSLQMPLWNIDQKTARKIGEAFARDKHVASITISDYNGETIFSFIKDSSPGMISRSEEIRHNERTAGYAAISLTPKHYRKTITRLLFSLLAMVVITAACIILSTGVLLKHFLRKPLEELNEIATSYASGRYDVASTKLPALEFRPFFDVLNGMGLKITAQIKDLHTAEEKYRNIFDNAIEGIFQLSNKGKIINANPALALIMGYDSCESLMDSVNRLPKGFYDTLESSLQMLDALKKNGIVTGYETLLIRSDGNAIWCSVSVREISGKKRGITFSEGFILDIAERKKAEEDIKNYHDHLEELIFERTRKLQEANKTLQKEITEHKRTEEALKAEKIFSENLIETANTVVVTLDPDGYILTFNKHAEIITGYNKSEVVGKNWFDLLMPMYNKQMIPHIIKDAINQTPNMAIHENTILTKKGEERTMRWSNSIIRDVNHTITGMLSIGMDITEQKRTQEIMIQTEKMMSVGGLAAGMAHEINNPLAGMIQNAQVVLNRVSKNLPANQKMAEELGISHEDIKAFMEKRGIIDMLHTIITSGERAATIINNMLTFSRKSDLEFEPQDLASLIDKTLELAENDYDLKKRYDFKQINIIREYDKKTPNVPCSATKIQQVILNLIKNGAQAIGDWEEHVTPPTLTLRLKKTVTMAIIEVEDNGPGMEESVRKRIFEPFFTTKAVGTGTGLGLSVSYFIITENHEGKMTVESCPGSGTKFSISLPFNPSAKL